MWATAHFEQVVDFQRQIFILKKKKVVWKIDSQKVYALSWLESTPIEANDKFPIHSSVR